MWDRRIYNTRQSVKHRQNDEGRSGFYDTQVFCFGCDQGYVSDHPRASPASVHLLYWNHHDQIAYKNNKVPS